MLQAIRSKAASLVVKVLFAALILSFGVWGIGDIFRNRTADTTVAQVGGQPIRAEQLAQAVRAEVQRLRGLFGPTFDIEQAKQIGIVDQSLDGLIDNTLIGLEVNRLGLAVGDDTVRAMIFANSAFKNDSGQFDPQRYQQLLAANRIPEAQYLAGLRDEVVRSALIEAVSAGAAAPKPLVDTLYRIRAEQRVAETVSIPAASAGEAGEPSETELVEFHAKHPDLFRAPELRTFLVAYLKPDDLAQGIAVSADELTDAYQKRLDEFQTPERRHLEQILVADEATAQRAESALRTGKNFATVAKDVAQLPPDSLDLGWVTRDKMPPELGQATFELPKDGVSEPIKSRLGWHIVHVVAIEAPKTEAFEAVKSKLASDIARDRAADRISKLTNDVDDALAGDASLDDVVQKFKLKTATATDIDLAGHAVNGATIGLPSPAADILRAAFNTEAGQVSGVTDTSDGGFYIVRVDKVTPAAVRPLAEVRDQAVEAWREERRNQRLESQAKEMVDAVKGGTSLKDVAAQRRLTVKTTPAFERTGGAKSELPASLVAKLFELKLHQAASGPSSDGYVVAELTQILPADPKTGEARMEQLQVQLGAAIENDLVAEYSRALRQQFPVSIDQSAVDRGL